MCQWFGYLLHSYCGPLLYLWLTANIFQWFVNILDINVKTNTIFLELLNLINIVVA